MFRNSMKGKAMEPRNPQRSGSPRPGDYELGSLESRAAARAMLDRRLTQQQKRFRVHVRAIGKSLKLENTRCTRSMWPDGTVSEMMKFDGGDSLTAAQREQLEQLIRRVPIDGKEHVLSEFITGAHDNSG